MTHQVTLHYDEQLLRRAVRSFWLRTIGLPFIVLIALAAVFLVARIFSGDRSWLVGVLAAILAMCIAMAIAVYVAHYRQSMKKFRAMQVPEATLSASEDSFTVASELGSSTLRWSSVTEVWQYPTFWLVFFSKAQYITLPLADIAPEARTFILGRIQDSGGKIR
jgi:uncharacterized membrane protein (DUF485 family)